MGTKPVITGHMIPLQKHIQGGGISPKDFCQKISAIFANSAILAHSAIWGQK